jgi:hypothetical protein
MAKRRSVPPVGRFVVPHGAAAKVEGASLVFEAVPDGVRAAPPIAAVPQAPRDGGRFTSDSASEAARKRWELAKQPDFARRELEFVPTEEFAEFDAGRRDLLERRSAEETTRTGACSSGTMTTLRGYTWLVAFAELYAARFAKAGNDDDADRARKFFKDASIELAKSMEIARAEAASRPRNLKPPPWLVPEGGKDE